jgi:hypothetical protein
MKRRTKADWQVLVDEHAASGQTATAFCRAHGLNSKYFSTRRRALVGAPAKRQSKFSPVSLPPVLHNGDIRAECAGGVVLRLPSNIEPIWLAGLLRALRD